MWQWHAMCVMKPIWQNKVRAGVANAAKKPRQEISVITANKNKKKVPLKNKNDDNAKIL